MKKFTKLLGIVLIIALVMSMGTMAFAANGATNTHTITITNADQVGKHTYEAYQVFAGDYDSTSKKLSNITWGAGVDGDAILAAVKADTATFGADAANATTAADVAALLGTGNDTDKAKAFAAIVGAHLATVAGTSTAETSPYTISVTGDGYYFIEDKANTLPTDTDDKETHKADSATRYILQVVGDVNVAAKSGTVESKKKVQDINDSTETALSALADSADYDIGDTIPYTLTMKLPANYADYKTYTVSFVDDMSKGLDYVAGSAKIKYGSADAVALADPTAGTSTYTDGGHLWKWTIANLKTTATNLQAGDTITITYNAKLNDSAVIGAAGNPNKYHVEFSNNPNGDGTGETPDDLNIVFTYDIEVDKVTGTGSDKEKLKGAAFALYKLYTTEALTIANAGRAEGSKLTAATSIKYDNGTKDFTIATGENWVLVDQTTAGDNSEFTFSGVDDGTYLLVETTTPAGYNSILPSKFKVTAVHADGDTPSFTSVAGEQISGDGLAPISLGTKTKSATDNTVNGLKTEVVNQSGTVLPSTGGIGTTIFYVVGSIMVVAAGVLLITKKRMGGE